MTYGMTRHLTQRLNQSALGMSILVQVLYALSYIIRSILTSMFSFTVFLDTYEFHVVANGIVLWASCFDLKSTRWLSLAYRIYIAFVAGFRVRTPCIRSRGVAFVSYYRKTFHVFIEDKLADIESHFGEQRIQYKRRRY